MHRLIAAVCGSVLIVLASAAPARAQQTTATFAGIVTDKQGGVLPGVDVERSPTKAPAPSSGR
jgi:hypothetical protein